MSPFLFNTFRLFKSNSLVSAYLMTCFSLTLLDCMQCTWKPHWMVYQKKEEGKAEAKIDEQRMNEIKYNTIFLLRRPLLSIYIPMLTYLPMLSIYWSSLPAAPWKEEKCSFVPRTDPTPPTHPKIHALPSCLSLPTQPNPTHWYISRLWLKVKHTNVFPLSRSVMSRNTWRKHSTYKEDDKNYRLIWTCPPHPMIRSLIYSPSIHSSEFRLLSISPSDRKSILCPLSTACRYVCTVALNSEEKRERKRRHPPDPLSSLWPSATAKNKKNTDIHHRSINLSKHKETAHNERCATGK